MALPLSTERKELTVSPQRRPRAFPWLPVAMALPLVLFLLVFFAPAVSYNFLSSLWRYDFTTRAVVQDWSLGNYRFLTDDLYLRAMWTTVRISLISTAITLVIGYPFAYFIMFYGGRFRGLLILITISPLLLTVVIRLMGWLMILGPGGVINQFLVGFGFRQDPAQLVFNELGVIIGLSQSHIPHMTLPILAGLQRLDRSLPLAARGLGANPIQAFLRVTLPLSIPGILAGSILVFVTVATAFATPHILGGGRVSVMPVFIYEKFMVLYDWPLGAALGLILLVMVLIVIAGGQRWVERSRRFTGVFQ
ncbi:MAG: ABC transporter permease [Chloroflexi bacterium]|nr:ABC transporter permease [Chloroflexota bacterium]